MAVAAGSSNLPAPRTSFIGRRAELTAIRQGLAQHRLLTLAGMGGTGKTRLALEAGPLLLRSFPDGVRLVELAQLDSPALLDQAVAIGLGVRDQQGTRLRAALIDHLASRRLLLILDNCEHLVAGCAVLADELLSRCPGLRILATSRQPLGVAGESVLRIPPLPLPPEGAAPDAGDVAYDSVRLLVERARAVSPRFAVTDANRLAIVEICRRLDGIPLALELAAARLEALTVEQLLARLDNRFRVLNAGSRAAPPRHQALRAVIDWSHDLLSEPERALARRLSIFSGDFDLESAETICEDRELPREDLLGLLAGLVEKSLVIGEPHGPRMRYRLLETIRQYCRERLVAAGEEEGLRERHLRWYAALVAAADGDWLGPRQGEWLNRMEAEHDNLRAALEHAAEAEDPETGLAMAAQLWLYWYARGRLSEGRRFLERLLEVPGPETAARARATGILAYLCLAQGDTRTGIALAERGVELARPVDDPRLLGEMLVCLGIGARAAGDPDRAASLLSEGLAAYRRTGSPARIGIALSGLAGASLDRGDVETARRLQEESIALKAEAGDDWNLAFSLFDLGVVNLRAGDVAMARDLLTRALGLRRRLDDRRGIAVTLDALAWTAAAAGDHRAAARLLGAAASIMEIVSARIAPWSLSQHQTCESECRRLLGDAAVDRLLAEGAALGADVANPAPAPRDAGQVGLSPLTAREAEVADLVAAGLSNREIARRLGVSQRTAETHVEHILSKLGFTSRAQVAAWVVGRRHLPT